MHNIIVTAQLSQRVQGEVIPVGTAGRVMHEWGRRSLWWCTWGGELGLETAGVSYIHWLSSTLGQEKCNMELNKCRVPRVGRQQWSLLGCMEEHGTWISMVTCSTRKGLQKVIIQVSSHIGPPRTFFLILESISSQLSALPLHSFQASDTRHLDLLPADVLPPPPVAASLFLTPSPSPSPVWPILQGSAQVPISS